jgi:DNA-binding NtrC family response regulator
MRSLRRSAESQHHLVITGAPGTGKSRVAGLIHEQSPRRDQPLLSIDAVAIGPRASTRALFHALDSAGAGTLLLDNVHELPFVVQCDLAKALPTTRARVIAMSHLPLGVGRTRTALTTGLWRQLRGGAIRLPSLRDRHDDIAHLADDFVKEFASLYGLPGLRFSSGTIARLECYSWPGNVRQLRDVVRRAALEAGDTIIEPHIISASA